MNQSGAYPALSPGLAAPLYRGSTVVFASAFYDRFNAITTPPAPSVNVVYSVDEQEQSVDIPMVAPGIGQVQWTALWDTRGVDPGTIFWSVNSGEPIPAGVQDGSFFLSANPANLESF